MVLEGLNEYVAYIGSDEAGKGEWLGPLVVAAVALSKQQRSYLVTQGVMDSKELRLDVIAELAKIVQKSCLSYHVVTISPFSFNIRMKEVKSEGRSLNDLLAWGHQRAIGDVLEELDRNGITGRIKLSIDMFDRIKTENRLKTIIDLGKFDLDHRPKAESETSVAAASIVARAVRELWIDGKSKELRLDLRKLSVNEAISRSDANSFAKLTFLKHRKP
jgi:ribonuclease HIII